MALACCEAQIRTTHQESRVVDVSESTARNAACRALRVIHDRGSRIIAGLAAQTLLILLSSGRS
jgi:hypothetical protein